MRINSPKQTEASRTNGSKSKGPRSPNGREEVRFNALKDGIFSQEVVIEIAEEKRSDFEQIKAAMRDYFQPTNIVEEMLVADVVENLWRRQRVRRSEVSELKSRLESICIREKFRKDDEVQLLQSKFLDLLTHYDWAKDFNSVEVEDEADRKDAEKIEQKQTEAFVKLVQSRSEVEARLEDIRQQLASSSLGVEFLIGGLRSVEIEIKLTAQISSHRQAMLLACCGFGNIVARVCRSLSYYVHIASGPQEGFEYQEAPGLIKEARIYLLQVLDEHRRSDFSEIKESTPKESAADMRTDPTNAEVLLDIVRLAIKDLTTRKLCLQKAETFEVQALLAASSVPSSASDRYSRAESAVERRMYRALTALLALRGPVNRGMKPPELPEQRY